ncbi:MAG: tyrosine-protein phosphatase [Microthrixaceae bacterium]
MTFHQMVAGDLAHEAGGAEEHHIEPTAGSSTAPTLVERSGKPRCQLPALLPTIHHCDPGVGPADQRRLRRRSRRSRPPAPGARVEAQYLEAALEEMESRFGSIEGYFEKGLELSDETLDALRAGLVRPAD